MDEVRKEINHINGELVQAIAGSAQARSLPRCQVKLKRSAVRVRAQQHLDRLHTKALSHALKSVCDG
ncbi:hypothetical protein ACFY2W_34090 [Streptomyces sp. NPDC001262]|uniref:hypothetical protein n=1 Tax=Streptomyces sp. NPDC001262 TaxID=3364552 RepID=UPI0036909069